MSTATRGPASSFRTPTAPGESPAGHGPACLAKETAASASTSPRPAGQNLADRKGQAMFTHARWAAGLALIAALAAGCGTGAGLYGTGAQPTATAHSAAPMPAATHHHHHARAAHATATAPPAPTTAPAETAN